VPTISLSLGNVSSMTVLLTAAGIGDAQPATVTVTTDGPVTITFVRGNSSTEVASVATGSHAISLPAA